MGVILNTIGVFAKNSFTNEENSYGTVKNSSIGGVNKPIDGAF